MRTSKLSTVVWIGFLLFLVSSLNCFAGVAPVSGLVVLVDVKLADSTLNIQKIVLQPGVFNDMRMKAPSGNAQGSFLVVLGHDGSSLYEMEFHFPVSITIPPAQPGGSEDQLPSVIPLDNPEITLIVPFFEDADTILITNSGDPNSAAIISMSDAERVTGKDTASAPQPAPAESDKMNLLIMASGYDSGSFGAFQSQADKIKGTIVEAAPFGSQTSKISVHIYANTNNLGCYSGCYGIKRLICCDSSKVISAASISGFLFDEILVVHNTATYAGCGYRENMDAYKTNSYNTYCAVYDGSDTALMALHEFGHSFGNLCDEYSYGSVGYTYTSCVNCMASCSQYPASSACQLGCDAKTGYYRPDNSIMFSYTNPVFNDASILADYSPDGLKKRLNFFTNSSAQTVLSVNPTNRDVAKDAGTTTFSVSNAGTGTMPWTAAVTSGDSWLSITSGVSGSNSGTITCSYSANTTTSSRTATICVTASGAMGSPMDVMVTQAPSPTVCTATIDGKLLLHIPYLSYVNPIFGTVLLWTDLVYEFNPTYPTLLPFKWTIYGAINDPTFLCVASTLSSDFKIHIPDLLLPDGITHIWTDLEYSSALSTDGNAYFVVTNYGVVSN